MNKIYNFENGTIEVYNVVPDNIKIKNFKKTETERIAKEERILTRNDNISWFTRKKNYPVLVGAFGLEKEDPKKVTDILINRELIRKYFNGEISGYRLNRFKRHDSDKPLYSLEIDDLYLKKYIQLSKNEYVLELLKHGMFNSDELLDSDLSFLNNLISIPSNPETKLDFPTLVLYHNSGLISEDFDGTLELVENSSKVYKKIRNGN